MAVSIVNDDRTPDRQSKFRQYILTSIATLAAFSIGTNLAWTSPALPLYSKNDTLTISKQESSWICSLTPLGGILGSLAAGTIMDKISRKRSILISSLPLLLCGFVIGFARSKLCILLARFVAGLACGAASIVFPIYLSEILEEDVKKPLVKYFQLQISLGILFTYISGLGNNLPVTAMSCVLAPAILSVASLLIPESPVWLISQNRTHEAKELLKYIRGRNYLTNEDTRELDEKFIHCQRMGNVLELREHGRATVIVLGLIIFQQLSGINFLLSYSNEILEHIGFPLNCTILSILVGLKQVAAAYFSNMIIEQFTRKLPLFLSLAMMSISMFIISGYFRFQKTHDVSNFSWIPILCLIILIVVFNFGSGPVPWIMIDCLFPDNKKRMIAFSSAVCSWIFAFVAVKTYQDMLDFMGTSSTFATFGMITLIGTAFVAIMVPETEGKCFEEIQEDLQILE